MLIKLEHSHFAQICAIDPKAIGQSFAPNDSAAPPFEKCGNDAFVKISGPLCYAPNKDFISYREILSRIALACQSDATRIFVPIDSPGGDVFGAFDASRCIRAMSIQYGKPIIAYSDSKICSAAYALAVGCTDIWISESAMLGSIGVIALMADRSAQNAAIGLKFYALTSGTRKADGNPELPISEDALAATQKVVDIQANLFFQLCAEMRGGDPEDYRKLEAGELVGAEAVKAGLASAILPYEALQRAKESEPMPKEDYEKAMAALKAVAEGDGDEETKNKAKKALAAADEKEEPKAETEEEKDPKAEVEEDKDAKALAATAQATALKALAEVHTLKASGAKEKISLERDSLIASRKDFTPEFKAVLADAPIETVRDMVAKLPKGPDYVAPVIAAKNAGEVVAPALSQVASGSPLKAQIDALMGLEPIKPGVIAKDDRVYFSLTGKTN